MTATKTDKRGGVQQATRLSISMFQLSKGQQAGCRGTATVRGPRIVDSSALLPHRTWFGIELGCLSAVTVTRVSCFCALD